MKLDTNPITAYPDVKQTVLGGSNSNGSPSVETPAQRDWTAKTTLTPPLKWHGGKHYLAKKILQFAPPHIHYVEPYFGGGAVLLTRDPEGSSEVANDINGDLTNFWHVLQDEAKFETFGRMIQAMPFSQVEWKAAAEQEGGDEIERAVRFFVFCRQSRAGLMQGFATLTKNRTRRNMNEQASAWWNAVEGLPQVHERLKRVVILNDHAPAVIRQQDGPNTLFYCDPPYLQSTRTAKDVYHFEMTEEDHRELLVLLNAIQGKVMLSGYRSDLYDSMLLPPCWKRIEFGIANHASGGSSKRRMTECLWLNFDHQQN